MITKSDFIKILGNGILIGDGAMGTVLQGLGIYSSPEYFIANDKNAEKIISQIHFDYLKSGSNIIQTSTFGANLAKLESGGLKAQFKIINEKASFFAKIAINNYKDYIKNDNIKERPLFIAGNLGPTGKLLKPYGDLTYNDAVDIFSQQVEVLLSTNFIDIILIETMMDINEALAAIEASKKVGNDITIICTLTFNENGVTMMGNKAEDSISILMDAGCTVAGANCSVGSDKMLNVVKKMRQSNPSAKLIFQPNAGLPKLINGKTTYNETPEIMAENIKKYLEYSPSILGACCGSTPDHIKKIYELIYS